MPNINDYLAWRGDLPISARFPWNEVDSLVMARFSYLIFDKIEMKPVETISSISEKMKDFADEDFAYHGDRDFIHHLGESPRFNRMRVSDYEMHNDPAAEKQFSAITVHLPGHGLYLSYLGTDNSLVGWKEDFNLSFMEHIPAQQDALDYLLKIADKYPSRRLFLGGHSKGGNIAIYAAVYSPQKVQERIVEVNNYDGPGFLQHVVDENRSDPVVARIHTYFPQSSVIGRIMDRVETPEMVHSTANGIYQHDIYSWQVERDHLVRLEHDTNTREIVNGMLQGALEKSTLRQRELFVDGVYEILQATNCTTFDDLNKQVLMHLPTAVKGYRSLDEEDRKGITYMLNLFARSYMESLAAHFKQQKEGGLHVQMS